MSMRFRLFSSAIAVLLVLPMLASSPSARDQNATNGVYGGYVGSDRWFHMMNQSARQRAVMESLAHSRTPQPATPPVRGPVSPSPGSSRAPKVGPGYQAPKVGPGYQAPKVGPGYQAPGSR